VLAGGKNSRLYKRLVYDLALAQNVSAGQYSNRLSSLYLIDVTARPSQEHPDALLSRITAIVDEELRTLRNAPPDAREMARAKNGIEASFVSGMETVAGKADQLNAYFAMTGNPDYFGEDLARYRALHANDIQAAVRRWLPVDRRVELSVIPVEE
jgi:zinc protease